jgi:hypothetical protein
MHALWDLRQRIKIIWICGVEVLTAVTVKSAVFWVVTPCSSERTQRFGGIYLLNLQGRRVRHARNQQKQTASYCWFLTWFTLRPWRWRRYVSPKRRVLSGLNGFATPKIVLFMIWILRGQKGCDNCLFTNFDQRKMQISYFCRPQFPVWRSSYVTWGSTTSRQGTEVMVTHAKYGAATVFTFGSNFRN